MMKTPLILAVASTMALTACVDPNAYPNDPNARQRSGAVIGGLVGAVTGAAVSSDDDRLKGAIVGGALGAGTGALIGADLDRQAAELRGSLTPGISVTNNGQFLVVNMPQDLLFDTSSAAVRPDLRRDLQTVAASLIKYPNSRIEVIGHTDSTGSAAYNQDLSQRRASAVANVLRDNGVPGTRVAAIGRGEEQPVASNLTPEGRAQNRRVGVFHGARLSPGPISAL
jgi:outer membrane protein OmpA-like peptidoglycan-associated protein